MILMRNIIREGHPTLTKKSVDFTFPISEKDKKHLRDLKEFVVNSQDPEIASKYHLRGAVGISLCQINILKRAFAVHFNDFDKNNTLYSYIIINPKIINHTTTQTYLPGGEGCLSVDAPTKGITPRYVGITMTAISYVPETDTFENITLTLTGYATIVFQHEYDHLDGILFTSKEYEKLDYATPLFTPTEK